MSLTWHYGKACHGLQYKGILTRVKNSDMACVMCVNIARSFINFNSVAESTMKLLMAVPPFMAISVIRQY